MPPLTLLTGKKTKWSDERNRMLAVALTILESETCKGCGNPLWHGHSTDNAVQFKVKKSTCFGCAELDKVREQQQKAKKSDHGAVRYAEAYNAWPGEPLPGRDEYYAQVARAAEREAAEWEAEEDGPPPIPIVH